MTSKTPFKTPKELERQILLVRPESIIDGDFQDRIGTIADALALASEAMTSTLGLLRSIFSNRAWRGSGYLPDVRPDRSAFTVLDNQIDFSNFARSTKKTAKNGNSLNRIRFFCDLTQREVAITQKTLDELGWSHLVKVERCRNGEAAKWEASDSSRYSMVQIDEGERFG